MVATPKSAAGTAIAPVFMPVHELVPESAAVAVFTLESAAEMKLKPERSAVQMLKPDSVAVLLPTPESAPETDLMPESVVRIAGTIESVVVQSLHH